MSYKLTEQADTDIANLIRWGAKGFGLPTAERYAEGLNRVLGLLGEQPRMARLRHEFRPPFRAHPYQSHMIFFRESGDGILVFRVLHGSADWHRLLDGL